MVKDIIMFMPSTFAELLDERIAFCEICLSDKTFPSYAQSRFTYSYANLRELKRMMLRNDENFKLEAGKLLSKLIRVQAELGGWLQDTGLLFGYYETVALFERFCLLFETVTGESRMGALSPKYWDRAFFWEEL